MYRDEADLLEFYHYMTGLVRETTLDKVYMQLPILCGQSKVVAARLGISQSWLQVCLKRLCDEGLAERVCRGDYVEVT